MQRGYGAPGNGVAPGGKYWAWDSAFLCESPCPFGVRGPLGFSYAEAVAKSFAALSLAEINCRM